MRLIGVAVMNYNGVALIYELGLSGDLLDVADVFDGLANFAFGLAEAFLHLTTGTIGIALGRLSHDQRCGGRERRWRS